MDQSGAPLAVSLSCDINTGKNQSDCMNCLKCLRLMSITDMIHSRCSAGYSGTTCQIQDFVPIPPVDDGKCFSPFPSKQRDGTLT